MTTPGELANAQGVSINQFLSTLIAERIGELKALRRIRARIARADPEKARAVLALVPDQAPLEGDEMLTRDGATTRGSAA